MSIVKLSREGLMGAYRYRDEFGNVLAQALPLPRGRWYVVDPFGDHHIFRQDGRNLTSTTHGPLQLPVEWESLGRIELGMAVARAVADKMGGGFEL